MMVCRIPGTPGIKLTLFLIIIRNDVSRRRANVAKIQALSRPTRIFDKKSRIKITSVVTVWPLQFIGASYSWLEYMRLLKNLMRFLKAYYDIFKTSQNRVPESINKPTKTICRRYILRWKCYINYRWYPENSLWFVYKDKGTLVRTWEKLWEFSIWKSVHIFRGALNFFYEDT